MYVFHIYLGDTLGMLKSHTAFSANNNKLSEKWPDKGKGLCVCEGGKLYEIE